MNTLLRFRDSLSDTEVANHAIRRGQRLFNEWCKRYTTDTYWYLGIHIARPMSIQNLYESSIFTHRDHKRNILTNMDIKADEYTVVAWDEADTCEYTVYHFKTTTELKTILEESKIYNNMIKVENLCKHTK